MGVGYSSYQKSTGIALDELPENLAKMKDLSFSLDSPDFLKTIHGHNLLSKYNSFLMDYSSRTTDNKLLYDYVPKGQAKIIQERLLYDYKPISLSSKSTLSSSNKQLISYNEQDNNQEVISTLSSNNKRLISY